MAFTLKNVVPWGRLFSEYIAMFDLTETDLQQRILGCGDGPASFNSTLTQRGGQIISIDPIYQFTAEQIQARFNQAYSQILDQVKANQHEFVWTHIRSTTELAEMRTQAFQLFIDDYEQGRANGRYQSGALPKLPFATNSFDLALCSHFLFLYSPHFSTQFHLQSIQELCRIAQEVRIFPLLELGAIRSRHLDPVITQLHAMGYKTAITSVTYEFQKGGNQMLSIQKPLP